MLLLDILQFLLSVFFDLLGMLCLLRLYMQLAKVSFVNPIGQGIIRLTNWLILPLQRILPRVKKFDLASLMAAYLSSFVFFLLLWTLFYLFGYKISIYISGPLSGILYLFYFALLNVCKQIIYMLSAIIVLNVVLSWLQPRSPAYWLTFHLSEPLTAPFRKILPKSSALDFSPFVALLLLQVLLIVVRHFMAF